MNLKKPKFWDYKKPNIYAYCLQPIAYILQILNWFLLGLLKKLVNEMISKDIGNKRYAR